MRKEPERSRNYIRKDLVASVEIDRKEERGEDHHHGGAIHFLLRGPRHALHLDSDVRDVVANALQGILTNCQFIGHSDRCFLVLWCFSYSREPRLQPACCLAGAEGLEPP